MAKIILLGSDNGFFAKTQKARQEGEEAENGAQGNPSTSRGRALGRHERALLKEERRSEGKLEVRKEKKANSSR